MSADEDVAHGILVPPSRPASEGNHAVELMNGNNPDGSKTTPAHIEGDDGGEDYTSLKNQIKEKDERIHALEQKYADMESKYKSELETSKNEVMETKSTVHLMQSMLDDNSKGIQIGLDSSTKTSVSTSFSPPPSLDSSQRYTSDQLQEVMYQNENQKFRIEQLFGEKRELETQLKIAIAEARDAEGKLKRYINERDDAMVGVDKERIWMSTQLSNCEQQILQLQTENISLLLEIREEKEKRKQLVKEMGKAQDDRLAMAVQGEYDDTTPTRLRFGFKKKTKKLEDEENRLAFGMARAYFARKQEKQNERYDLSESLQEESPTFSKFSLNSSIKSRSSVPSSKGQADLLARHMFEKKPSAISVERLNGLPLTLVDEIKMEKIEKKRQKALDAMLQ